MNQLDAQAGAAAQQPRVHKGRSVVDIDSFGYPAGRECGTQRGGQPDGVLGETEPVPHHRPAVIINEREQERLVPGHNRAVQRVLCGQCGYAERADYPLLGKTFTNAEVGIITVS